MELEELKKIELEILKDFINVCNNLKLRYFVIGGTLIGTIRHKGFIPWDDDIDVAMPREDYEKFINQGQKYLKKNLFIQTYKTDPEYLQNYAKIRDNNTTFIEKIVKNHNINHGIFIDIFPLDTLYNFNKIKLKLLNYQLTKKYLKTKKNNLKTNLFLTISNIFYKRKNTQEICKIKDKIYQKGNSKKNNKYLTNYCGAWGIKKESHLKKEFENYKLMTFEDIKVRVPIGYDNILTNCYGDYMKLPPKEKRIVHHETEIIDTKKSYLEYINRKEK